MARKERSIIAGDTLQDTRQLVRLLAYDQVEASEMHRALTKITNQLEKEGRRTADAVARAQIAEARVMELEATKQILYTEIKRDREALKNYQIQVEVARKEIAHAQGEINRLAAEKYKAEEEAARERSKSRQIQKDLEINLAIDKGRLQGYLDGRDEGWRQGRLYYTGEDRRNDEYYDEIDGEGGSPLSPPYTTSGRFRQPTAYPDSVRSPTSTNPLGRPNDYSQNSLPETPSQQNSRRRYGNLVQSAMSPIRETESVRSHVSNATQMQNNNLPMPMQGSTNGLELSMQMPIPQPAFSGPPSVRASSVRPASVQPGSVREPSVRPGSVREPSVRPGSVREPSVRPPSIRSPSIRAPSERAPSRPSVHRRSISTPVPNSPSLNGQFFASGTPQQMPNMPLLEENGTIPLPAPHQMAPQLPTPITPDAPLPTGGLSPRPPSLVLQEPTPPEGSIRYSGVLYDAQNLVTIPQPQAEPVDEYSPRQEYGLRP